MIAALYRRQSWLVACAAVALLVVPLAVLLVHIGETRIINGLSFLVEYPNTRSEVPAGEIRPGLTVGQSFRAGEDMLQAVAVHVATYGRTNTTPLFFSLREYPQGTEPLRTAVVEGQTLQDNTFYYFSFPPIRLSAGKLYLFTLESPQATEGNALTVWVGDCDCYSGGALFLNGEEQEKRDADFRLNYRPQVSSAMSELLDRMSQYKPWFFKGLFVGGLGALSLALMAIAVGSFAYGLQPSGHRSVGGLWVLAPWLIILALAFVLIVR